MKALPLVAVGFLVLVLLATSHPLCGFALVTGIPCPGCGLTRATGQLLQGNLEGAHAYHPLVLMVLAELLAAASIFCAHAMGWIRWRHRSWVTVLLAASALLLVAVWAFRLANGTAPAV